MVEQRVKVMAIADAPWLQVVDLGRVLVAFWRWLVPKTMGTTVVQARPVAEILDPFKIPECSYACRVGTNREFIAKDERRD